MHSINVPIIGNISIIFDVIPNVLSRIDTIISGFVIISVPIPAHRPALVVAIISFTIFNIFSSDSLGGVSRHQGFFYWLGAHPLSFLPY